MREKIFSMDTPFFRIMSKIGDFMLLNLMWLICSLPVITIGASTTALIYTGMHLAKGRDGYVISKFWKSFRQNFAQSTIIYLILAAVGAALGYSAWYWINREGGFAIALVVITGGLLVFYLIEVLFVFAVQAKFYNTIGNTMKNALIMGIQNFPITVLCLVGWGLLFGLNYMFPVANVLTLVVGVGAYGWVLGMFYNVAFRKYLPIREKAEEEIESEPMKEKTEEESEGKLIHH